MGQIVFDTVSRSLLNDADRTLSIGSKRLLEEAHRIAKITPDNIFIGLDLNDKNYHDDLSTMIIIEFRDGQTYVKCHFDETDYLNK